MKHNVVILPEDAKEIPDHKGYYADQSGGIYSGRRGRIIKLRLKTLDKWRNSVTLFVNGENTIRKVSKLIALTFLGLSSLSIRHKNGIATDDRVENLEYFSEMNTKEIEGFSNYFVDRDGNVYSKYLGRTKKLKLRFHLGYLYVNPRANGKSKLTLVHRLIASAFIPNPKNKPQINHINGIKTDNRVDNLEWVTHSENMQHAVKNKLWIAAKGESGGHAKHTEMDVVALRLWYDNKLMTMNELSEKTKINYQTVFSICKRITWKHI